jgi:hypothetical protein
MNPVTFSTIDTGLKVSEATHIFFLTKVTDIQMTVFFYNSTKVAICAVVIDNFYLKIRSPELDV